MPYYRQNPNFPMQQEKTSMQPYQGSGTMPMAMPGTMPKTMPFPATQAMPAQMPVSTTPAFPSGIPTGPAYGMAAGPADVTDTSEGQPAPVTLQSQMFIPGYLRTQLGKKMRVEFLIGTNSFTDRTGTLVGVGASYILLQPIDSDDIMLCDLYSIKFVTIIR